MMDKLFFDQDGSYPSVNDQGADDERNTAQRKSFLNVIRNPFTIALLTWLAMGIYLLILRVQ
ncbi:MAG TPA: hypothetical protein PK595_06395 [Bacteroidota bacterium]|nr:hypothetical protein [Bacteroidota bacterium]